MQGDKNIPLSNHQLASDEFELLLYRLRFDTIEVFFVYCEMFEEVRFVWFTVRLFPARSNAVMLNATGPFVEFV